ncbi:MAG: hypothetical protein H6709_20150 [Kofleriaceae bacterium]|nr:hypothetical protein [Kofleriaceae bacterium]MCB9574400.1 hypothetical protein [Kofleriaceae bacterium]
MSIVESLKRLFDPATQRREEGEQEAARELPEDGEDGDPPGFDVPVAVRHDERRLHRCRICDHEADRAGFCPVCLADTMIAVEPARRGPR